MISDKKPYCILSISSLNQLNDVVQTVLCPVIFLVCMIRCYCNIKL